MPDTENRTTDPGASPRARLSNRQFGAVLAAAVLVLLAALQALAPNAPPGAEPEPAPELAGPAAPGDALVTAYFASGGTWERGMVGTTPDHSHTIRITGDNPRTDFAWISCPSPTAQMMPDARDTTTREHMAEWVATVQR